MANGFKNIFGEERIESKQFQTGDAVFDVVMTDWFFGTAGGTQYIITAETGVFTKTGIAITFLLTRYLVTPVTGFTLSGKNNILIATRKLQTNVTIFTKTGIAVNLITTRFLLASATTFIESGKDNILTTERKLQTAITSFNESGKDIILTYGRKLLATTTIFTDNHIFAQLSCTRLLCPSTTTFTESGKDIHLKADRILSTEIITYILTGKDIEFIYSGGIYFGVLKRWTGSIWMNAELKIYNGSLFINKPAKRWTGTEWLLIDV